MPQTAEVRRSQVLHMYLAGYLMVVDQAYGCKHQQTYGSVSCRHTKVAAICRTLNLKRL